MSSCNCLSQFLRVQLIVPFASFLVGAIRLFVARRLLFCCVQCCKVAAFQINHQAFTPTSHPSCDGVSLSGMQLWPREFLKRDADRGAASDGLGGTTGGARSKYDIKT